MIYNNYVYLIRYQRTCLDNNYRNLINYNKYNKTC